MSLELVPKQDQAGLLPILAGRFTPVPAKPSRDKSAHIQVAALKAAETRA